MGKAKISLTREELIAAFANWYSDYKDAPSSFVDYDAEGYDPTNYALDSAEVLIRYINTVQEGNENV